MTITAEDIRNIRIRQWEVTFGGLGLGLTVEGSANIELNSAMTKDEDATELEGIVASIERGIVPTFTAEFKRADFQFLFLKLIGGRVKYYTDGTRYVFYLGNKNRNLHDEYNEVLDLQPAGIPLTDKTDHVRFWKTAMIIEGVQLLSSRESTQTIPVTFEIYPDVERDREEAYGAFGDFTVVSPTPLGLWWGFDRFPRPPYKNVPSMGLEIDGLTKVNIFAAFGTDSGETVQLNDAGNMTLTSKTFTFDNLSEANLLREGSVLKAGTEFLIVDGAPTYATTTSGTAQVFRKVFGSVAVAHLDDAVFNIYNEVAKQNVTEIAVLTSADPSKVTIGDVFQSSVLANEKGIVKHVAVAAGTNVTGLLNTVTSAALSIETL